MARILFIRVSAVTFDEKDVIKAWPMLCATVWPDPELEGIDSTAKIVRKMAPVAGHGVLELVDALADVVRFGDMPENWKTALQGSAQQLADLRARMDEALGNRDVPKAHALTEAIENALDEAEDVMRGLKK